MGRFENLRKKYSTFIYHSYNISEKKDYIEVSFNFETVGLTSFNPMWKFPKEGIKKLSTAQKELFEKVVFNLGMVEALSYIKATCSPSFIVEAGYIEKGQIEWFKKLYVNGLGEFFYKNDIVYAMNQATFVDIKCDKNKWKKEELESSYDIDFASSLVPVGGGKDSALSLEILKDTCITPFVINSRGATEACIEKAGLKDKAYKVTRTIDNNLLELNKKDFLNGHTPFSAIVAFSAYAVAVLLKKKYIVLSNEASANEVNIVGTNINHQYSKSIEFENDFREYTKKYLLKDGPEYFSILRPLTEWQIVKNFAKNPKYFKVFKSCNVGSKKDIWCENCPKCLYMYIMLKAFLSDSDIAKIFKEDLLDKKELIDIFNGLIYPDLNKPFECVGTKEEINLCLNMIIKKLKEENKPLPLLLRKYKLEEKDLDKKVKLYENAWNNDNNLDNYFEKLVREYMRR